jgi:hypothetical protein
MGDIRTEASDSVETGEGQLGCSSVELLEDLFAWDGCGFDSVSRQRSGRMRPFERTWYSGTDRGIARADEPISFISGGVQGCL